MSETTNEGTVRALRVRLFVDGGPEEAEQALATLEQRLADWGETKAARSAGVLRVETQRPKRRQRPKLPCCCGCGEETANYFAPGHDAKLHGALRKVAKGEATPTAALGKVLTRLLGPWQDSDEGGKVPASGEPKPTDVGRLLREAA